MAPPSEAGFDLAHNHKWRRCRHGKNHDQATIRSFKDGSGRQKGPPREPSQMPTERKYLSALPVELVGEEKTSNKFDVGVFMERPPQGVHSLSPGGVMKNLVLGIFKRL